MGRSSRLSNSGDFDAVIERVSEHELPEPVRPVIDRYDEVVGDRHRMFWRWLDDLFPAFRLSCVDPQYHEDVQVTKLLVSIFITVLDDTAEKHDDRITFGRAAAVPFDTAADVPAGADADVVVFTEELWDHIEERNAGPRSAEFGEILRFDLKQVIDAIEFSYLANHQLNLLGENELWAHDIHNMAVFVYADIDLAHSPAFDANELSAFRDVVRHTERIARLCNWIGTWERELSEGDCSSGMVASALETGIVSLDQLRAVRADPSEENVRPVIEAIHEHELETTFGERIEEEFVAAEESGRSVTSLDIDAYLEGFEEVQRYHGALKEMG